MKKADASAVESCPCPTHRERGSVAAAFLASFGVFGVTYSFGVFLEPMAAELHASRATTSALFSIAGFASYMLASLTGHLNDRFGPRLVVGVGAIVMSAGMVLTAFIGHMWSAILPTASV